jgi:opacity protein-like surface antigen
MTPRLRGDITFDFRAPQKNDFDGSYTYDPGIAGTRVDGTVRDAMKVSRFIGMANLYFDILPRGVFSPYIGAGVGFVYNQINRDYQNTELLIDTGTNATLQTRSRTGSNGDNNFGLAAALMGGVTIAFDHRWAIDVGYRALYLQGGDATITTTGLVVNPQTSMARLGDAWEHQVRIGLRFNIW